MKRIIFLLLLSVSVSLVSAQEKITVYDPEIIQGVLEKVTVPLSEYKADPNANNEVVKGENLEK